MALKLRPPGGERTWIAIAFMALGSYVGVNSILRPSLIFGIPAALLLIFGVGLWFKQQWARWGAIAVQAFLAGYWIYSLFSKGWNWMDAGCFIGSGYFIWCLWKHFSPARMAAEDSPPPDSEAESDEDKKPMISLVLFLREPRYLEAPVLAQIVSAAWGGEYSSGESEEDESQRFVVGESPLFAVQSPEAFYVVHNFDRQYFDDTAAAAEDTNELRLRKAIEDHQAWLAVDLISLHDENAAPESVYPHIAKLIAELAGDDCLAIYQPETNKINVWDAALEEKLRGPNALEEFAVPTHLPVIRVDDDDPRMLAAVTEARKRWPEFVTAFKQRAGQNFAVKAPVTVGDNTEFIWISVDGLEPEYVHGTLDNDPVDLGDLKHGSRVEVAVKDLNDWAFLQNDEPVGLFTVKVLAEIQSRPQPD
jgi:uncharacterized protein YegJ (DUF2314 family)